MEFSLLLST